jgi:carbamoyl-phosphate synthase small subunit
MRVNILFENGVYLQANGFGEGQTVVGEVVFNTSITGYQEIITDPSYAGQFITFTMPEIGNVGVNSDDMESSKAHCKGIIVRNYNENYSNFRAQKSLNNFLKENSILGIKDIDTRFITKMLREEGAMMMIASTEIDDKKELEELLKSSKRIEEINYIEEVSTKESYIHNSSIWSHQNMSYSEPKTTKKIVAIDFGVKRNILNELVNAGAEVEVISENFSAQNLIERFNNKEFDGIFLSNGPGDPLVLTKVVEEIKQLIDKDIPMFGICLGHQLLSIAHGQKTYKLQFGQHGGNHPVKNLKGVVEITAQNHNYSVPDSIRDIADVTHINLFDNTIEGVKYKDKRIFSVQHHPESSPGPNESAYIFKEFIEML